MIVSVPGVPVLDERLESPTAHASVADVAATPFSSSYLEEAPGCGLGTRVHELPSQCKIRAWGPLAPTAHTSLEDVAATARRPKLLVQPIPQSFGTKAVLLETCVQDD